MKKRMPWMKLPVYDRLVECGHMDIAKIGAYFKLVMLAWTRAGVSIPNDTEWIKERLVVDDARYQAEVDPVLTEFWVEDGDDLILPWLRDEAEDAAQRSHEASENANRRWDAVRAAAAAENIHPLKLKGNS